MGKLKLLNTPNGTLMYIIKHDRLGEYVDIQEVKYGGYKLSEETRYMAEEPHIRAFHYIQPTVEINFKKGNKKISYTFDYIDYWNGQRAYDTDEHLECGGAEEYPYIDVYFTTSKESAIKYIKNNIFDNLKKHYDRNIKQFEKINSFIS